MWNSCRVSHPKESRARFDQANERQQEQSDHHRTEGLPSYAKRGSNVTTLKNLHRSSPGCCSASTGTCARCGLGTQETKWVSNCGLWSIPGLRHVNTSTHRSRNQLAEKWKHHKRVPSRRSFHWECQTIYNAEANGHITTVFSPVSILNIQQF